MPVWIKYRLGWYDLLNLPYLGNAIQGQSRRICQFGTPRWIISLALLSLLIGSLILSATQGVWLTLAVLKIFVAAVTRIELYAQSAWLLIAMIIAFDRMQRWHHIMSISIVNVFPGGRQESVDNVMLWPTRAPLIGAIGLVTLILTVPYFAALEEIMFRALPNPYLYLLVPDVVADWLVANQLIGVVVWSVGVFGLAHLYSGSRLGDCLALGLVGGSWFALQNWMNGLHVAIIAHTNYNLVALAYMMSPHFQQALNAAINAALEAFNRPKLMRPPMERVSDLAASRPLKRPVGP